MKERIRKALLSILSDIANGMIDAHRAQFSL